jgi:ComF family protein
VKIKTFFMFFEGLKRIVGWFLPPACVACNARLPASEPVGFCPNCYAKLPWWDKTGVLPPQLPAAVAGFAAPLLYEGVLREVILRWKFHDRPEVTQALARLMAEKMPEGNWLLVPVPLHVKKLRKRTYNHAALLAQALGRIKGLPVDVLSLRKVRDGKLQAAKTRAQRLKLSGTDFECANMDGRQVVLVDDIFTTGATARACALALRRAGAVNVQVRTLCYTAPGRDLSA